MFAIGIRYLCGWSMATDPSDREKPEWPPHPDRIFMALAAAFYESERRAEDREALEWLETLGAPALCVSPAHLRFTVKHYVPVNDDIIRKATAPIGTLPIGRSRQDRAFPVAIPDNDTVHLIWEKETPSKSHVESLSLLCRRVSRVGHSASLVSMWVENSPPSPSHVPVDGAGVHRLRVAGPGRMSYLERCFNEAQIERYSDLTKSLAVEDPNRRKEIKNQIRSEFKDLEPRRQRPAPGFWSGYAQSVREIRPPEATTSIFHDDMMIFRAIGKRRFSILTTAAITEAIRGAVMSASSQQPPPEWISGHEHEGKKSEKPHLAFLALPDVGHAYADGHVLGAAIVVPRSVQESEIAKQLKKLTTLDKNGNRRPIQIVMGSIGESSLEPEDREDRPRALRSETWVGPALRWATVTPIILDRFPKTEGEDREIVAKACERIGLPSPSDVVLAPVSLFEGVPPSAKFPPLSQKPGKDQRLRAHALITFSSPVKGPIILGAGRYRGYGLCSPFVFSGGSEA